MSFLQPLQESWEHALQKELEFLTMIEEGGYQGDIILSLAEEKSGTLLEKRVRKEISEFLTKEASYRAPTKGYAPEDNTIFFHWPTDENGEGDPYPHDQTKEAA
jgi:hypothetical protein